VYHHRAYYNRNERVRTEAIKFVIIDDFFTRLTVLLPKSFGAVIRETFIRGSKGDGYYESDRVNREQCFSTHTLTRDSKKIISNTVLYYYMIIIVGMR